MNPERNKYFIEAENCQRTETGSFANGDVCMSRRTDDGRTLLVLTHGRGSGIQANVTASVISSMIVSYAQHNAPIGQAAQSVLNTFGGRGSQTDASFAVADIHPDGTVAVAEYETPPFLLFRQGTPDEEEDIPGEQLTITAGNGRKHTIRLSRFNARPEDRILFSPKASSAPEPGHSGCPTAGHGPAWRQPLPAYSNRRRIFRPANYRPPSSTAPKRTTCSYPKAT